VTDLDTLLAAEVDRLMPGWSVDLDGGHVQFGPQECPRCGTLVVLIDLPRPRLVWWREITADGLAARLGPAGRGPAGSLRVHEAWRCRARRDAAFAALVDLDAEDRPPGPDAPR